MNGLDLLGLFLLAWIAVFWVRDILSYPKVSVTYADPKMGGRPTAKVVYLGGVQTYVCYQTVNGPFWSGAYWISLDTGRQVSQFDRLYEELNNAARKAQLENLK